MNKNSNAIDKLMSKLDLHPVLVDVGASGKSPKIWNTIDRHSIYIGFDPDQREIRELPQSKFYKAIIVNAALNVSDEIKEIKFNLTRSPYCSSTLKPNTEALSNYLFWDLFTTVKEKSVKATTMNSILGDLSITHIDWFKTDSQGTDLRLFDSLRNEIRSRVIAVDVEPGLIDAYVGEDLFIDVHDYMVKNGFWLSNLDVCGTVRMSKSTFDSINSLNKDLNYDVIQKAIKESPGWCEARYLRTIDWLSTNNFSETEYIMLWIFSLLDDQTGFALDVAFEYEKLFGFDDISQLMKDVSISHLKNIKKLAIETHIRHKAISFLPVSVKNWIKSKL